MCKYVETFNLNKGCKLAVVVFIPTLLFSKYGKTFQTLFAHRKGLAHPYFLSENESLQNCRSYDMR